MNGPAFEEVQRLIEKGNSKSALEVAKGLHKRYNNAVSERLVVDAYGARIASLREHRMTAEADALANMVRERFPLSSARLNAAPAVLREILLNELVQPLNDPALEREGRARIEEALKKRLDDPAELASCSALAPDHTLRTEAVALDRAFRAVTSGPVTEEHIALPAISRRSPLAPWKSLVRAIASFYEHEEETCRRHLDTIAPESPAARAVPVLRGLLQGRPDSPLKLAARALFQQAGGGLETLRSALEALDRAFASGKKGEIVSQVSNVVCACRHAAPDFLERLKQHISIKGIVAGIDDQRIQGALGGACLKDAYFWLLFARAVEGPQADSPLQACSIWEEFRIHAIREGWFPAGGAEVAGLYLHMADLLQGIPSDELEGRREEFRDFVGYGPLYEGQPREIRAAQAGHDPADRYYTYPEQLYERACALDPRPEAFLRWMMWANGDEEGESNWKAADRVAEAWRRALPSDARPLIALMLSAERRNAHKKALGFIEEAERLDPLNPEVRRSRLKLLIDSAIRHIGERKTRLAEREFAVLDTLPQAQEARRPVIVSALRWACSRVDRDDAASARHLAQAANVAGSEATAVFVFGTVGYLCGLHPYEWALPLELPLRQQELLAATIARAYEIGIDVGLRFGIPDDFEEEVRRDLERHSDKFEVGQLRWLAEAAVLRKQDGLVYAVSTAGLARGGPSEARFLLIRAKAIPPWDTKRRNDCIAAAAELARRSRDMELVHEAVELRRDGGSVLFDMLRGMDDRAELSEHELGRILKRERAATKFIKRARPSLPPWFRDCEGDEDDDEFGEDESNDPQFELFLDELAQAAQSGGRKKRKFRP